MPVLRTIWLTWAAAALLAGEPSLILHHARVWTGDAAAPWAEAVAIEGNRIAAVGGNAAVLALRAASTRLVDAGGRTVAPGFNDAHIHFLKGSLGLDEVDLTGACSLELMLGRVRAYAEAHPHREWIFGRGWEYYCFPGQRLPLRQDLDAVVKDRPVYLAAYDGHTAWVNTAALRRAEITRDTRYAGFGEIVRDAAGEPTGCLKEDAQGLVRRHIPPDTRERKLAALRQGMKLAASLGITSIQNASGGDDEIGMYEEFERRGELTLRVYLSPSVSPRSGAALPRKRAGERLRVGAIKLMLDGVIESHTAAMLAPYANKPDEMGTPAWDPARFREKVAQADREGWQIFTHAIGDGAVRMTLDAYEEARRRNGARDARHRIEHIETVSPADIPRFARLGVIASMMPIHADPATVEVWSRAVGAGRLPYSFAWRSLERAGARLAFSSDWPASISVNPIRGIHNAMNRRTVDGKPPGGWVPAERVALETALKAYTSGAAWAEFQENEKGTLRKGMAADLVMLSRDLTRIDPADIHKTEVDLTVFDGQVVFTR